MSDRAHEHWAMVAIVALMVFLVVGCTAVIAYWTHTAYGLWSLLLPLSVRISMSE